MSCTRETVRGEAKEMAILDSIMCHWPWKHFVLWGCHVLQIHIAIMCIVQLQAALLLQHLGVCPSLVQALSSTCLCGSPNPDGELLVSFKFLCVVSKPSLSNNPGRRLLLTHSHACSGSECLKNMLSSAAVAFHLL